MSLRKRKPVTPSSRFTVLSDSSDLSRGRPEKKLVRSLRKTGGRGNTGRITARHRGGGHRRLYRLVDFHEVKHLPLHVLAIEYDPNRSARLALVQDSDGVRRYVLATVNMKAGMRLSCGPDAFPSEGNRMPLRNVPEGSRICCLEIDPARGAQMLRAAGTSAVLMSKTEQQAQIKLPSGEIRLFSLDCTARIGAISNAEHRYESLGKAGRSRLMGRRPKVRGVVMNPIDHPLGGGEGKSSGGRTPVSPWGRREGIRTRPRHKPSQKRIVKRRKQS